MPRQAAETPRQWGRLPNVYRGALTMQQLREMRQLEALPPVEALALAGPASHRYVRQDDPLWWKLHSGVLTTGLVRSALGLYEQSAVKKVGIPSRRAGHGELLHAYRHLYQQHQDGSCAAAASTAGPGTAAAAAAAAAGGASEAAAAAHNAAAVLAYNAAKLAGGTAAGAACASADSCSRAERALAAAAPGAAEEAAAGKSKHARQRLRKKKEKAAAVAAAGAGEGSRAPVAAAAAGDGSGTSEEQKQRKARALGSLGLMSICCSWGTVQEGASLLQAASAFPGSQLAEVGLCRLHQELLPPAWGFAPGSLPPIGASPDALICHRLPTSRAEAEAEVGEGEGGDAAVANGGTPAAAAATEAAAAAAAGGAAAAAAASVACSGGRAAAGSQATAQAQASAAVGPWDIDALLPRLQLDGTGAPAPAGNSGAINGSSSSSSGGLGNNGVGSSGSSGGSSSNGGSGVNSNGSSSGNSSSDDVGYLIEVVEVKNTCPFGHSRRGGRLRTSEFAVCDRGPRQEVPPEWVPQLQLHMLCTGTPSGLLVSRSATKGTRIFRMQRDDELLRLMLTVISRLWVHHVLPGQAPPPDAFASWHVHHELLRRTVQAARGAQLVGAIEGGQHPAVADSDPRWFLD